MIAAKYKIGKWVFSTLAKNLGFLSYISTTFQNGASPPRQKTLKIQKNSGGGAGYTISVAGGGVGLPSPIVFNLGRQDSHKK
jgi:hypothetical protein